MIFYITKDDEYDDYDEYKKGDCFEIINNLFNPQGLFLASGLNRRTGRIVLVSPFDLDYADGKHEKI